MNFRTSKIVNSNGIPLISVNGDIFTGMAFTLIPERSSEEYVKLLVEEAAIKLWFPIIKCEWPGYESEKQYDFSGIEMILAADPDALIIPRFALMPPPSWRKEHPDELAVVGNSAAKRITDYYSIASDVWLDSAKTVLTNLVTTLNNKEYAKNIIGIFTGIGSHTEGGGWSCYMEKECYDFSVSNRLAFTKFLKEKYNCFETIRDLFQKHAWKNWGDVTVPEFEERMVADVGMFHDPAEGGVYIREYRIFENRLNSDRLESLGVAVKEASENKLLYGCFHGYCGRAFGGGGSDLYGTLTSKHIDFLAAPPAYDDRAPGGSIAHSMPIDSINIHGKVFINECDVRTSLAEPIQRKYGAPKSLKQSSENIKHFLGYSLVHQNYGWYLEPGAPTDKREQWFNNSQLAVTMSDLNDSFHKYTEQKNEFKTEIAVIWDKFGGFDTTFTIQGDSVSNHFSNPGSLQINEMLRMEANRIGAPVNFYLIEDLVNGFVPENIKLFIFVNTWGMTKELRTSLKTELMRRKAAEMWFYGSAYVDRTENVLSLDAMNDLMGMHFSVDDSWGKMEIELNSQGRNKFIELNEITGVPYRYRKTGLGLHSSFTPSVPSIDYYSPFFSVIDDAGTEMLGNYKNKGAIALAHKKTDDRDIYYSGSPFASCNILREIAKCAGVHIYLDSNDALYMNGDIMLLHAATSGEKSICFPDGKTRKLNMKKGKTEIFTIK